MKDPIVVHGPLIDYINYRNLILAQSKGPRYNNITNGLNAIHRVVSSKRKYKRRKSKSRKRRK